MAGEEVREARKRLTETLEFGQGNFGRVREKAVQEPWRRTKSCSGLQDMMALVPSMKYFVTRLSRLWGEYPISFPHPSYYHHL
jgi:hypothetical protein